MKGHLTKIIILAIVSAALPATTIAKTTDNHTITVTNSINHSYYDYAFISIQAIDSNTDQSDQKFFEKEGESIYFDGKNGHKFIITARFCNSKELFCQPLPMPKEISINLDKDICLELKPPIRIAGFGWKTEVVPVACNNQPQDEEPAVSSEESNTAVSTDGTESEQQPVAEPVVSSEESNTAISADGTNPVVSSEETEIIN